MLKATTLWTGVHCFFRVMRAASIAAALLTVTTPGHAQRFEVTYTAAAHAGPITGRLILFLARSAQPEPRLLLSPRGPAIFGIDLDQLRPGQAAVVDNGAIGYPGVLADLPPGDYVAQAVLN